MTRFETIAPLVYEYAVMDGLPGYWNVAYFFDDPNGYNDSDAELHFASEEEARAWARSHFPNAYDATSEIEATL